MSDYLPLSQINTFLYCPRRFYYEYVEGESRSNLHLDEGQRVHETANIRAVELKRGEMLVSRRVYVASEALGVAGFVDVVEEKDGVLAPLEYKKGRRGEWLNDQAQLCAGALALEELTGRHIPCGYLYYAASRRRQPVEFTPELRALTRQAIRDAHALAEADTIPNPLDSPKCNGCSLEPICLPDEVLYLHEDTPFPPGIRTGVGLENVLYVDVQGAYLRKAGERILVEHEGEELRDLPVLQIDQIVLVGNVNLSTPVLRLLLARGIPVTYLSVQGRFCGCTQPAETRNALLRVAQHDARFSASRSLELARGFVRGKLGNMRTLVLRRLREGKGRGREGRGRKGSGAEWGEGGEGTWGYTEEGAQIPEAGEGSAIRHPPSAMEEVAQRLKELLEGVERVESREELLGVEGTGTALYFRCFESFLKERFGFDFTARTRRPPRDPVNALLSLAYALLLGDLTSACHVVGLDPYVGYLHQPRYGRASLALDLMEEFRPIVADSVVVSFINNGSVSPADFEELNGGFFLKEAARKRFYAAYEQRKSEEITHPVFEYRLPYRRAFELQARILAKYLLGEIERYEPLVVR